jgi:hypothetical protein
VRTSSVRLAPLFAIAVASSVAASACGGGPPASPTFSPTNAVVTADADAPPSGDGSIATDGGTVMVAETFARCGTSPATGSFPADIAAVLTDKCQPCHTMPPRNGAPFPLLTYENVHAPFAGGPTPIYQEMYALIQPGADPHMPFGNAPQLTADQFSTLSSWLLSCAPPGD